MYQNSMQNLLCLLSLYLQDIEESEERFTLHSLVNHLLHLLQSFFFFTFEIFDLTGMESWQNRCHHTDTIFSQC